MDAIKLGTHVRYAMNKGCTVELVTGGVKVKFQNNERFHTKLISYEALQYSNLALVRYAADDCVNAVSKHKQEPT